MSIEIRGMAELVAKLGKLAVIQVLRPPMQRAVNRLQAYMQHYPPAPAGSRYIRGYGFPGRPTSEKLGQRWTTRITESGNGITGKVGNNASYEPWVQSERFQTRFHKRTGWRTDQSAIDKERDVIVADFERTIQQALR